MSNRREFLARSAGASASAFLLPVGCARSALRPGVVLNDVHSGLNETRVMRVERPDTVDKLAAAVERARSERASISVAGGRHAMGGQQFGEDTVNVDTTGLGRVLELDRYAGEVEVEAGIQWPALHERLLELQANDPAPWGIRQKQSGADRLCLGGALAANVHSRALTRPPIVDDVAAFTLLNAKGELVRCSRTENPELFATAIGGYGLFGVMTSVRLRLAPRQKVQRHVELIRTGDAIETFDESIARGDLFGDFQYATDYEGEGGFRKGVFSSYHPVDDDTPVTESWRHLGRNDWLELVRLAHTDRVRAFDTFAAYSLSTNGHVSWADSNQLATYVKGYHEILGKRLGRDARGGEMITEVHVPHEAFVPFLEEVREDFRASRPNLIYGTVRLVEPERDTFLRWARSKRVCVIFNLHVRPERGAVGRAADALRAVIDRALAHGGGYYLTYHRWATREQLLAAYPMFPEFLARKRSHDPDELFQSDWYRHYAAMFTEET